MELEREREENEARTHKEKFEAYHDPHPFQRGITPTPPQEEKRRNEPKDKNAEEEAKEPEKKLEACSDPYLFQKNDIQTPSQKEGKEEGLDCDEKEDKSPKPTETPTATPVQNKIILVPTTQESPPDDGNENNESVHPGGLDPDETKSGVFHP